MKKLSFAKVACIVLVLGAVSLPHSQAQTFTTLASFNSANGANPDEALIQGLDGDFYGTTAQGGANNAGTIFRMSPAGKLSTLYSFCSQANCTDGKQPLAPLLLASDGSFYGTTIKGGANNQGTVFKIAPGRALAVLYNFCSQANCADGFYPEAGLTQATNGDFYGTTNGGGTYGYGTIFVITPAGKLRTLYSFCYNTNDCGEFPEAGLIQAADGNFYGLTPLGGENQWGTVFEMTPQGKLTTLYMFKGVFDGGNPRSGIMQATNGNFYGTDLIGGNNFSACEYGCGTIFDVTSEGTLTTLYSFCSLDNCVDGTAPYGGLLQATDGNFYGTTTAGGMNEEDCFGGCGTLFALTPGGVLTTLHSFCTQTKCADGLAPYATLLQSTNGNFYGTTQFGGPDNCSSGCGTVFTLSMGLSPFAQLVPTAGAVATQVIILGNNLTGSTSVTFNGAVATFKVVSNTEITATVPAGATSGTVQVVTPSGPLNSNVSFRIVQ